MYILACFLFYSHILGTMPPVISLLPITAMSITITWTQPEFEFSLPVVGYTVTMTRVTGSIVKYSVPHSWKRTSQQPPHPVSPPPHSLVFKSSAVTQSESLLILVQYLVSLQLRMEEA